MGPTGMSDGTSAGGGGGDPTESSGDRSVISHLADCLVYAPLGLAFDARDLFPDLVAKGRNQVTVMKMLGRFAVQQGSDKGRTAFVDIGAQAVSMLPGVSMAGPPDDVDDAAAEIGTERVPVAPSDAGTVEPVTPTPDTATDPSTSATDDGTEEPGDAVDPPVEVSSLAIPDYDSLSALQVVPRLEGLTNVELEAVGRYEAATRARKTILNKVAQLQAG